MAKFDLAKLQQQIASQSSSLPPVENWDPAFCGDIDLCIKHDGTWHYMGTPINRVALVKLFASVLIYQNEHYFLVTPVEKVGITVADVPFLLTGWQQKSDNIIFTTNLDDSFVLCESNPLKLMKDKVSSDLLPYALVRRNLWARMHQNVFYQLIEHGVEQTINNKKHLIIKSAGQTFSLGIIE